ncbi:MAG: hypothetical protein ACLUO4_09850, partial [Christensenellales bacterium]
MSLTVNLSAFGTIWGLLGALFIGGMMYMAAQANMQRFLHLLHGSYQLDGYGRSVNVTRISALIYTSLCLVGFLLQEAVEGLWCNLLFGALAISLFTAICLETGKRKKQQKQKKEYVRTDRMKRLERCTKTVLVAMSVLFAVLAYLLLVLTMDRALILAVIGCVIACMVSVLPVCLLPQWIALSAKLRQNPEKKINQSFIDDAVRIIRARKD